MTELVNSGKRTVEKAVVISSHETSQEPGMTHYFCCADYDSWGWYRHLQDLQWARGTRIAIVSPVQVFRNYTICTSRVVGILFELFLQMNLRLLLATYLSRLWLQFSFAQQLTEDGDNDSFFVPVDSLLSDVVADGSAFASQSQELAGHIKENQMRCMQAYLRLHQSLLPEYARDHPL